MRRLLLISTLFLCCGAAWATHIVGGGFSLKWVSGDTYELRLRVLRDCENGVPPFNNPLLVGVYDKATNQVIDTFTMTLLENETLRFVGLNCAEIPTGCTHVGSYKIEIHLPVSKYNNNVGYYFSWERCCRNNSILNIIHPEAAGMTFYMQIPPVRFIKNSTPVWTSNPVTLLCMNNPWKYNLNFIDPDNDSLHYSLVEPLQGTTTGSATNFENDIVHPGPYLPIQWENGYSNSASLKGSPPLTINPKTGELNVTPSEQGIFVASILVEEYRFGQKLGEVRLELQFTVTNCLNNPFPAIQYYDTFAIMNPGIFSAQIPDKLCFDIVTLDNQDSLFVKIIPPPIDTHWVNKPEVSTFASGFRKTTTRFCWQTACEHTGIAPLTFNVEVIDNGCPIPKTAKSSFTVLIKPMPLVNSTDILCMSILNDHETTIYYGDSTPNSSFFSKYMLYRSSNDSNWSLLDSIADKSQRMYHDPNTPENAIRNYSYFMRGKNKCGFLGPPSDTLGTFEQLNGPDSLRLITVTVEDNKQIKAIWPHSQEKEFAQYFLYRGTREQKQKDYVKIFETRLKNDTVFKDEDVDVQNQSYCYYLIVQDTCGHLSPMPDKACSIVLKGSSSPFEHTLTWLPYQYWDAGTAGYDMYRRDTEKPNALLSTLADTDLKLADDQLNHRSGKYWYYVVANEADGTGAQNSYKAESRSNEIILIQAPLLHVPNALTANQDWLNDEWGIRDVFVKDYHLKVFNGWGQLVFETKDKYKQWDGHTDDGVIQQSNVYVYIVTYTGWDESAHVKKGNVTVLR